MSTLSFQPEADRYYAEGYWRAGDLWGDFAARAARPPRQARPAPRRPAHHLRRAAPRRRRAVRAPRRRLGAAGRRGRAARPPLDRGGGRAARLPAPRRRARSAAADVQRRAALRPRRADAGEGDRRLRGRARDRQVRAGGAARRAADLPAARDRGRADRRGRGRRAPRAQRRRRRAGDALLRHHVGAEGHRALEQHAALRHRGHLPALGAQRRGSVPGRHRVRLRRRAGVRVLPGAAQRRHGRADEPVEARRGAPSDRGAPLHLRAADADARRRHAAWRRRRRRATCRRCASWQPRA